MGWMSKMFGTQDEEPLGPEAAHRARLEEEAAAPQVPGQKAAAHKTTAHKAAEPKVPAPATEHAHAHAASASTATAHAATAHAATATHSHAAVAAAKDEAAAKPHPPTGTPSHPTVSKGTGTTLEHDQMLTVHIMTHVPDHAPRTDDPHYHLFEQAKARLKKQGLWKCIIDDDLCEGGAELHHTHVEFSQINQVDESKIQKALGLHFQSDEEFQAWAESPGNLEVLCANHHRAHYGIHMIPGPLWEALRFHKTGTGPAAEFVPSTEADADVKSGKATAGDASTAGDAG